MKIKTYSGLQFDPDTSHYSVLSAAFDLCGQGRPEGSAEGLIPLRLPGNVVVTPRVSVTSATTTSKRGVRSAVVKVSLPYTAVTTDDTNSVVTDPSRSQGEISMHIVLALPRNAVADLTGKTGASSASAAAAQAVVVSSLLRSLLSVGILERPAVDNHAELSGDVNVIGDKETQPSASAPKSTYTNILPKLFVHNGSDGIDASQLASTNPATSSLTGYLVRIANGLAPLGCNDVLAPAQADIDFDL